VRSLLLELVVLPLQRLRHAVERLRHLVQLGGRGDLDAVAEVAAAECARGLGEALDRPQRGGREAAGQQPGDAERREQRDQGDQGLRAVEPAGRREVGAALALGVRDELLDAADRRVHVLLEDVLGVGGVVVGRADAGARVLELVDGRGPLSLDPAQPCLLAGVVEGRARERAVDLLGLGPVLAELLALALLHIAAARDAGALQALEQRHAHLRLVDHLLGERLGARRRVQQDRAAREGSDDERGDDGAGEDEEAAAQRYPPAGMGRLCHSAHTERIDSNARLLKLPRSPGRAPPERGPRRVRVRPAWGLRRRARRRRAGR
jgi:hypothetical protein